MSRSRAAGIIAWTDLTVPDAERLKGFYARVVGWRPDPVEMGGYDDFNMVPPDGGDPVAGICHARGNNTDLPPAWLIYIVVEDLNASLTACREEGGEVLVSPREMGHGSAYAVIRDPAGAVVALYQAGD